MFAKGVNKLVISVGTVDLANIAYTSGKSATDIANNVCEVLADIQKFVSVNPNFTLLYIMPAYISTVAETAYSEFIAVLDTFLSSHDIKFVNTCHLMSLHAPHIKGYEDLIKACHSDGIHCTFDFGRFLLTNALEAFGSRFHIPISTQTPHREILQRRGPTARFKCGHTDHTVAACRTPPSSLHCSFCGKQGHVDTVCYFRFLPCIHCGRMGHFKGRKTDCPDWKKSCCQKMEAMILSSPNSP
jgi:hypothetical protein